MIPTLMALALILVFFAGIYSGYRKVYPFTLLLRWKYHAGLLLERKQEKCVECVPFIIDIKDMDALRQRREGLITYLWGVAALPVERMPDVIEATPPHDRYRHFGRQISMEQWTVRMDFGIDSRILVFTPHRQTKSITIIYQQGHEGDITHGTKVIRFLLSQGFRVVALAMPLLGTNSQPTVNLRRHGQVQLQDHDYLKLLDHEYGIHSVRFFVEPVLACVNRLRATSAATIAMLGSSGGGWTTTLYAAIDDRITMSFPVAGSLPFSLRKKGELADYENHVPELYDLANYPELHVLGANGEKRRQLQVVNEFDTVAWSGRRGKLYEKSVQEKLAELGEGLFDVMVDSSWVGHGISSQALQRIASILTSVESA